MDKYVTRKEVLKVLGIHYHTLYSLADRKEIETLQVGKRTLYNLDKYLRMKGVVNNGNDKINICYCRVSSNKQKGDLERQINQMKELYPNYKIVSDIGSSLNFDRKGLLEIINLGIENKIETLIIAYKDRLARIGYELIETILRTYSQAKIIIINKDEEETPEEELSKDIISIMNVYTAKINGLRKYKSKLVDEIKQSKKIERNG